MRGRRRPSSGLTSPEMNDFADRPLVGPGSELQLTIDERAVPHLEVLAGEPVLARPPAREVLEGVGEGPAQVNLYAAATRLAARAATPATRRQYAAIYRAFADWLRGELGRPPLAGDVDSDAIGAYARHLEKAGGRGGRPAALATRRVYLSMVRALARELGADDVAAGIRVPRHRAGPPETLTDLEYHNLLRVPDRRTPAGRRDHALLRILGDCGLRSAELRQLEARDLRSPRSNARHRRLYVRGKGGTEREVPIPEQTLAALEAWLAAHPLARGRGLRDEQPLFVRLGRHPGSEPPEPLSAQAVHKLVRRYGRAAGIVERLCHPHALRAYWATTLLDDGVPIHHVSERLGHADLRTTSRYAAVRPGQVDDVADVLDRRHQHVRRSRGS
jgi:site-specific recombinase XerD